MDLAAAFLSLKKIGLIHNVIFKKRKKTDSPVVGKSRSQAPTTGVFQKLRAQ